MIEEIDAKEAAHLVPLNIVVQNLHAAHHPEIYPADPDPRELAAYLAGQLARPGWFALGWAEEGEDTLLGYVLCEVQDLPGTPLRATLRRGMVHAIAVAEAARRRGIGFGLIEAAKVRFRTGGATRWGVSYRSFNAASAALMARAGAQPSLILAEGTL